MEKKVKNKKGHLGGEKKVKTKKRKKKLSSYAFRSEYAVGSILRSQLLASILVARQNCIFDTDRIRFLHAANGPVGRILHVLAFIEKQNEDDIDNQK